MAEISVSVLVAERIKDLGPKTEEAVIEVLVQRVLKKQTDALVVAIDRYDVLVRDMRKLEKPDEEFYSRKDGKMIPDIQTFSKTRKEAIEKQQQAIDKLAGAINKALEKQDFGDVYNLVNQKQGGSGGGEKAAGDAPAEGN